DKEPIAAVAGWLEGGVDGVPSGSLRTNLVGYTFPGSALEALRENGQAAVDLKLDRDEGALQIEYVYVSPAERGKRLATKLIQAHIDRIKGSDQVPGKVQIQVFNNNDKALSAYLAMGFQVVRTARSQDPRALELLPFNEKSLLELTL
ncbi:MAG: GNAT family N-acetyltransferase, partial [Flavobacteriales bacterium]